MYVCLYVMSGDGVESEAERDRQGAEVTFRMHTCIHHCGRLKMYIYIHINLYIHTYIHTHLHKQILPKLGAALSSAKQDARTALNNTLYIQNMCFHP
jgi:hypothetical protein